MRTTVVPAQVTTVEDKIAGSLGFTQLLLLVTPVFLGAAIFVLFPPLFQVTLPKCIVVGVLAIFCALLAVRIRGILILSWLLILARYNRRSRYFVYNKNDLYLRDNLFAEKEVVQKVVEQSHKPKMIPLIEPLKLAQAQVAISDPRSKFQIRTDKKGVLRAYIHEIPEEAV